MENNSRYQVFFDFDNTITPFDVLDDIILRFSRNRKWVSLEKAWKQGRIGSKKCLEGQIKQVRMTRQELLRYLSKIRVPKHFSKLFSYLRGHKIGAAILSDDFSFVIKSVLRNNGIKGIKIYANKLRFSGSRLLPEFPYTDNHCKRCGHCKKNNLLRNTAKDKIIIYIGDGLSDTCPAKEADIVFAKGSLLKYLRRENRPCIAYKDFRDIYAYLRRAKQ